MEESRTIENLLSKSPVFEGMETADLEQIKDFTELAVFQPGERICRKGREATFMLVLIEGRISMSFFSIDDSPVPVFTLEKEGDTTGFSCIQHPFVFDTDIVAVDQSRILKISAKDLRKKVFTNKQFGYLFFQRINSAMCQQLYVYRNLISDFAGQKK